MIRLSLGRRWTPVITGLSCLLILSYYTTLINTYPGPYWHDAHIRWALRGELLLGPWLPVTQFLVNLAAAIKPEIHFLRHMFSIIAIACLLSFYHLSAQVFDAATGLMAVILLSFNKMFAALAVAPYPDVTYFGLITLILICLQAPSFSPRFYFGILFINPATLTRYAGWVLPIVLLLNPAINILNKGDWKREAWKLTNILVLSSLIPILWLVVRYGEMGNSFERLNFIYSFLTNFTSANIINGVLERLNPQFIMEFGRQFFHLLILELQPEYLLLGLFGLALSFKDESRRYFHFQVLLILIVDWCLLAFLQPWASGNLRQPFFILSFLIFYSSYAFIRMIAWLGNRYLQYPKSNINENYFKWLFVIIAIGLVVRAVPTTT